MRCTKNNYVAVDLGATSGRLIVYHDDKLDEIHRFDSYLKDKNNILTWDIDFIFRNIIVGLKKAFKKYKNIKSLAIDSWGVDYVLMNKNERIDPVYSYRDSRTLKVIDKVHNIVDFKTLYKTTGTQYAVFNSIYQLKDDLDKFRLTYATDFLHIPEYLSYLLTGKKVKEYTMATTTGLVDLKTGKFNQRLIAKLGLPKHLFTKLAKPGEVIGKLKPEIVKQVKGNLNVVTCASHDTASAFEAVDIDDKTILISSGTWSLVGVKLPKGNNSSKSRESNFTNEGGVGYIRYLKNIMGMWIFNQVMKNTSYSYTGIFKMVKESKYDQIFNVNDSSLLAPKDMKKAVINLLKDKPPKNNADLFRSIFYSLAESYKEAIKGMENILGKKYSKICIIGGGAKNKTLNNIIKKVTNKQVIALPIEATSIGNIKIQKGIK